MIHIKKSSPPAELAREVAALRGTPDARVCYANLKTSKQPVKDSLVQEQHGLCAYCMRRIKADGRSSIEHIIPQHDADGTPHDRESVDYGNMLAVCRPNSGPLTCDRSRGNMPMRVNPLDASTLRGIRYTRDGEVCSADDAVDNDLKNTLNLNSGDGYMCEGRAAVWRAVNKEISRIAKKCGNSNHRLLSECERKKKALLSSDIYPEYVGVILFRLDHFIRKFSQ